jgi:hypothetical protein
LKSDRADRRESTCFVAALRNDVLIEVFQTQRRRPSSLRNQKKRAAMKAERMIKP